IPRSTATRDPALVKPRIPRCARDDVNGWPWTIRERWFRAVALSHRRQRLFEVREDVFDVLDPHRDPDQPRGDAQAVWLFLGDRGVGHRGRARDEGLDPAEAFAERAQADFPEKLRRGLE